MSGEAPGSLAEILASARALARRGEDEAAKSAYFKVLQLDPTHFDALNDLAALLVASGHRSAARRALAQAVALHPGRPAARVNLGHLFYEDGDSALAEAEYRAALEADPDFAAAHQGLARVLSERGQDAEGHRRQGFAGHAVSRRRFRGQGQGIPLLLLLSTRLGNVATQRWLDDRLYAVTEIFAGFFDPDAPLPPHRLIVNAIGDADLCADELRAAERLVARSPAPVVNAPAMALRTGRVENAGRLGAIPGVIVARTERLSRADLLSQGDLLFPLLLRAPGYHTGQHFARVAAGEDLRDAVDRLPGDALLRIDWLDARGADGLYRKYRVIFVDGEIFPLHLAGSQDWKVHYFSSEMAENAALRAEEEKFLADMPTALGARAMGALAAIAREMALDFAGVDFGLAPDGALLLFEANATMNVFPPPAGAIWDYRRNAAEAALAAARRMIFSRAGM